MKGSAAAKKSNGLDEIRSQLSGGADLDRHQGDVAGFQKLASIIKVNCGIDLPVTPKNLSLMASRLRKVLAAYGIEDYKQFADLLNRGDKRAMNEFICAMTTNTTHFFREKEHFAHLRKSLPAMVEAKRKANAHQELRVWCAAASTGQEPFTILMTILGSGALPSNWTVKFLATDIDLNVLEKAARATYREDEVENVPASELNTFFDEGGAVSGERLYRIKKNFASMIRFARLNLVDNPWPFEHKFDVIFCRNVMIYFDGPTARDVVERQAAALNTGGLLYIGHSEMGHAKSALIKSVAPAVYERLPSSQGGRA